MRGSVNNWNLEIVHEINITEADFCFDFASGWLGNFSKELLIVVISYV